ncbi:MAG: PepSY domain-containing protein [Maritimibacter sp.]|nr:PepSY domain-containing protein [Maritimibacter sp.]
MRKLLLATALVLATAPAFAADLVMGTQLGTSEDAIRAALTELGWEVRKLDTEDGMIEVYAVMGDKMAEIYIDPTSGEIVKISAND